MGEGVTLEILRLDLRWNLRRKTAKLTLIEAFSAVEVYAEKKGLGQIIFFKDLRGGGALLWRILHCGCQGENVRIVWKELGLRRRRKMRNVNGIF